MARHPNRQELTRWLDGSNAELDEHIDTCTVCASQLDEIDLAEDALVADLRPALLTLLQPPDDLHGRVSHRIAQRLQNRQDMNLFGSMLGIPIEASRLFFTTSDDEDSTAGS